MPTIVSHAAVAVALGSTVAPPDRSRRFWVWTALCAMLPDLDVIGFAFGVPYGDMLGHRGLTHSVAFALILGLTAAFYVRSCGQNHWRSGRAFLAVFVYFSCIVVSHGLLDAFTDGGRGIALLAPFSDRRFFFPWRPIRVSPIGVGFFSARGLAVLQSELRWILLPSAIIVVAASLARLRGRGTKIVGQA